MPIITLCEQRQLAPNQFQANLQVEGGGTYPVTIINPFDEQQEARLEWYFEGWLRRPFLNTVTAAQIKDSIPAYGETLFDQVSRWTKLIAVIPTKGRNLGLCQRPRCLDFASLRST